MNYICVIIIGIIFAIQMILIHNQNVRNRGLVCAYSATIFAISFLFGAIPSIYFLADPLNLNDWQLIIQNCTFLQFLYAELSILIFTVIFDFSYKRYSNSLKKRVYCFDKNKMIKSLKIVTWVTFILGGISLIIYINAFGGVMALLRNAEYLRSFATSGTEFVSYLASILVIPSRMITVTPISVFPLIKDNPKNKTYKFVFSVSMALSIIFLLANAGKAPIIIFFICFFVSFIQKVTRHPWRWTFLAAGLGLPLLNWLDSLFVYFQNGVFNYKNFTLTSTLAGFVYPYRNLLFLREIIAEYGYRWGQDLVTGVLNIIPGVTFTSSYEITSEFFVGTRWEILGGVPTDIITFGYLQFGLLGVVFIAGLFGVICGKIDRVAYHMQYEEEFKILLVSIAGSVFSYISSSDISGLIRNQFQFYLIVGCVLYSTRNILKNKNINRGTKQ